MILKKKIFILLVFMYFSLILGSYFGEDVLGGAYYDYKGMEHIAFKFKENFLYTLFNYDTFGHRHSPIFYIIKSIALNFGENGQKIFFLHVFLLIPIFFYKCLKIQFKNVSKNYLKLFAAVILLFPTFRGYSIWPDPHLLGTLFFIISIFYYLKTNNNINPFKNALLHTLFLSIAAYSSPNFGIFVIFFFCEFLRKFSISKEIFIIIFLNIILSLPFFLYLFYFNINFIFDNNGWDIGDKFYSFKNISNKIIIITSFFLFYLIPFVFLKLAKIKLNFSNFSSKYFWFVLFYLLIIYFFDFSTAYKLTNSGGGFFYNLSNTFFENDYLLFILCFFIYLYLIKIFYIHNKNFILFACLIFSNPQITIWQANFSPTIFFLIFLLFEGVIDEKKLNSKSLVICYIYFFLYLLSNYYFRNILI